eukprot:gene5433-5647_t
METLSAHVRPCPNSNLDLLVILTVSSQPHQLVWMHRRIHVPYCLGGEEEEEGVRLRTVHMTKEHVRHCQRTVGAYASQELLMQHRHGPTQAEVEEAPAKADDDRQGEEEGSRLSHRMIW